MAKLTEAQYKEKYEKPSKKRNSVRIIYKINIIKFLMERK